jgi:hypothetical protein
MNEQCSEDVGTNGRPTGGPLVPTSSEPDLRRRLDEDVEHGINLLVAGSPIDHSAVADDTLLDYDSEEETALNTIVLSSDNATSAMDVEIQADTVATASTASSSTVQDEMFYQCRLIGSVVFVIISLVLVLTTRLVKKLLLPQSR